MRWAASLEFLRVIDYPFPQWAEDYMARVEEALGDAYSEPVADVRGYIDYVSSQDRAAAYHQGLSVNAPFRRSRPRGARGGRPHPRPAGLQADRERVPDQRPLARRDRGGQPLLFVQQKRMKIKEDIRFRSAQDSEEHLS